MNKLVLTGYDLVAKGISKNQASLPEVGLKDVYPNGSWLEQKQTQAAIEARKHLLEAIRIEKSGVLNHAEWRENLMLAEVTQKTGGHWQYMGHNIGKQLFIYPEEALFLMEINNLLLKHNDVKVSLQQAYSLLIRDKNSLLQYKVYASLSRNGFKVFRHKTPNKPILNDDCNIDQKEETSDKPEVDNVVVKENPNETADQNKEIGEPETQNNVMSKSPNEHMDDDVEAMTIVSEGDISEVGVVNIEEHDSTNAEIIDSNKTEDAIPGTSFDSQIIIDDANNTPHCSKSERKDHVMSNYRNQIEKLKNRLHKPCDPKILHKCFDNLPSFIHNQTVCIQVPEKDFIPNNISCNKNIYTLNLQVVKTKYLHFPSIESQIYNIPDEVNGAHIRRVRSVSDSSRYQNSSNFHSPNVRFPTNNTLYRPMNYWQPFVRTNYIPFNTPTQRPLLSNMFITPRFQYYPRAQNIYRPNLINSNRVPLNDVSIYRKRCRDNARHYHCQSIKKLAARLKDLKKDGGEHSENVKSLIRLIDAYNIHYKSRMRLSVECEIVDDTVYETIELEDDDETKSKKPRLDESDDTYHINFDHIKQLANRLRNLENDNKASARHRRAFSNLVKTFKKSYNADIYVTGNFEVFDRHYVTVGGSSSDSDCVINEAANKHTTTTRGKKLRNPFNILKRLSEKQNESIDEPSTSRKSSNNVNAAKYKTYSETILKNFSRNWLPNENDFGRAEIVSVSELNMNINNYVYEFMTFHPFNYANWLDLKVSFLSSLEETTEVFQRETKLESIAQYKSLVKPEDCIDIVSVMKKLSIIKNNNLAADTDMIVDYDVYYSNVQNFRKTNPPTPHLRIMCLDKMSNFPTADQITALHAKYDDKVLIVFAVVFDGSISYLQMIPNNLPMYVRTNIST